MSSYFYRLATAKFVRFPRFSNLRHKSTGFEKDRIESQFSGEIAATYPKLPMNSTFVDRHSATANRFGSLDNAVQLDIDGLKQQVVETFLWMNGKLKEVLSADHVSPEEANSIRTVGGEQVKKVLALCDYVMASEKEQKEIITKWKRALKTDWEELEEVTKSGGVSEGSESENDHVAEYGSSGDADLEAKHGDAHPACLLARIKAFKKTCSETCVTLKKESHDPEALLQCAMVWGELGETEMSAEFIWAAVSTALKNVGLKQQLLISSHTKLNVFAEWVIDNYLTAQKQKFRRYWRMAEGCRTGFYEERIESDLICHIVEEERELVQALSKINFAEGDVAKFHGWYYGRDD